MKRLIRLGLLFTIFLLTLSCAWSFEIQWSGEPGFFIGQELLYNRATKEGHEEGLFVFGQGKEIINGIEYYDCLFVTATSNIHFYFSLNSENQKVILKKLDTGEGEINIEPFASFLVYPLKNGGSWNEKGVEIIGTNLEVPDLGVLPTLTVKNVKAETTVSLSFVTVPAGTFEALLVESRYVGDVMNIPMTLIQRTWLSQNNIFLKMTFELKFFSKTISIFDMEFVAFPATAINLKQKSLLWAFLKK